MYIFTLPQHYECPMLICLSYIYFFNYYISSLFISFSNHSYKIDVELGSPNHSNWSDYNHSDWSAIPRFWISNASICYV